MKLAILSNSPGPNQSQYFAELAKIPGVVLTVFYCARKNAKWQGTDADGTDHDAHFMVNLNPWADTREYLHCNPSALLLAKSKPYDLVLIQGYSYPTAFGTIIACAVLGKPFVFWGEMINRNPRLITAPIKHGIIFPWLRRARAVFTMGKSGVHSFREIGVKSSRIYEIPYSCNLESYLNVQRNRYGSNHRRRKIVVTAQLIKRKRVDIALRAFLFLSGRYQDWDMVICGDGPCRSELETIIPDADKNRVIFKGFVPKKQQPEIYADSDIFLLTSAQDGWGMVVPEAMAVRLPVISSTAVESALILLDDKASGLLVKPNSVDEVIRALEILIGNEEKREHMGMCARAMAKKYDAREIARRSAEILLEIHSHVLAEEDLKGSSKRDKKGEDK